MTPKIDLDEPAAPPSSREESSGSYSYPASMLAAFIAGALVTLAAVWFQSERPISHASEPAQFQINEQYVGKLKSETGGFAHVSYVNGVRIETPVSDGSTAEAALDQHQKTVLHLIRRLQEKAAKSKP